MKKIVILFKIKTFAIKFEEATVCDEVHSKLALYFLRENILQSKNYANLAKL